MTTSTGGRSRQVAGRVRAYMAEQQRNQKDMAVVLGISQPNASLRFRGMRAYSVDELDLLARWLDVRIEDFFAVQLADGGERRVSSGWLPRLRRKRYLASVEPAELRSAA